MWQLFKKNLLPMLLLCSFQRQLQLFIVFPQQQFWFYLLCFKAKRLSFKSVLMRWRHYNLNAIFSTGLEIPSCSHYLSVESIMLQATLQTGVVKYVLTFHILTLQFLPCRGKSVYLWLYQTLLGYGKGIVLFFYF